MDAAIEEKKNSSARRETTGRLTYQLPGNDARAMLSVLTGVARMPVEPDNPAEVDHLRISLSYTPMSSDR